MIILSLKFLIFGPMLSAPCVFCKIVAGEIPNHTVYEDNHVLAFLDIHPCAKGHTVVIPKKHHSSLLEMTNEEWEKISVGLKLTMTKIQAVLNPDGMNSGLNERPAAGQAVDHVHWHIIPRWEGDGGGSMHSIIRSTQAIDVAAVAKLFA